MPSSENNSKKTVADAWKYIRKRFGVKQTDLEGFNIKKVSGDFWLVSDQLETSLEVETNGFRFLRITGRGLKPTTYGLQFLGDRISENIVKLDRSEFLKLLKREEMIPRKMNEKGYVALKYEDQVVGCGYFMNETVSSRIPKGRANELTNIIE